MGLFPVKSVELSFGNLSLSENIAVQLTDNKERQLTWDTGYPAEGSMLDQVMLLAYGIENKEADFYTSGEFRYKGADQMQLNASKGTTWHIYVAFVAEDRSRQSNSL